MRKQNLTKTDPKIAKLITAEEKRQQDVLSMIPSENFFSDSVREAVGSVLMHKYSEGNIGKRYYEGNDYIDAIETIAINRAKKLFKVPKDWHANVQGLSGSNANLAVYLATLKPGDTIMSMFLPDGGHLSHGWSYEPKKPQDPNEPVYLGGKRKVHIVSRMFNVVQYKTDPKTQQLNYKELEKLVRKHKPKLIITGGTAYPREIDYKKMRKIADSVGALYLADIAHEAGLIAAGVNQSPVGIADVVTMTTHKTLRAGRGSIILAHEDIIKKINRAILPGLQGGPFNNNIAGIAVGLGEALKSDFKKYAKQTIQNAQTLGRELQEYDFELVSGGTDKHLLLIDLTNKKIFGKQASRALNHAGIVLNMNTMPGEQRSPADPSAIRLGTPWLTTRGMGGKEMKQIVEWIDEIIEIAKNYTNLEFSKFDKKMSQDKNILSIQKEVKKLCRKFPLN